MTTAAATYPIRKGWTCIRCLGLHYYCVDCGDAFCVCPPDSRGPRVVCEHDRGALKPHRNEITFMTRVRYLIARALDGACDQHSPLFNEDGEEIGAMYLMEVNEVAAALIEDGWHWTPASHMREDTFELERKVEGRHAQVRLVFGGDVPQGFTAIEAIR